MMWTCKPGIDLGFIPAFLSEDDPDDPITQIDKNYQHGGGWRDMPGFKIGDKLELIYPGDPPLDFNAMCFLHDHFIIVYPYSWVVVMHMENKDSFRVARID